MLGRGIFDQGWFLWGTALVVGFPMIVVVLGEIVQRLDRNGHPLANPLRIIRVVFIPALVVLLFAVLVMERNAGDTATRVATTGVWILGLFALLSLVTAHVFAEADPSTWRSQAPQLLVDILRVVLIAVGIALVLSTVWGTNLIGLFAALASAVLQLALPFRTLASLMGGVAILSEKPFAVGDWIAVNDTEGKVEDINWRTVRMITREADEIIIPNIVFGTQMVLNNSSPDARHIQVVPLEFSYDDLPNKVRDVLRNVADSVDGILHDPPVKVRTLEYKYFSVGYEVWFHISSYGVLLDIRSEFMTRVWFAARRHGLTIPFPMRTIHRRDDDRAAELRAADQKTRSVDSLSTLSRGPDVAAELAGGSGIEHCGAGEYLQHEGGRSAALSLVLTGLRWRRC